MVPAPKTTAPEKSSSKALQLHLGCGGHHIEGWVNCDLHATKAADVQFDCTQPWPFPDNSVSVVYCSHTLEHLVDFYSFFREAHRVLIPDGALQIRVPFGNHHAAWWDVSHVRPWFAESFCFVQPGYDEAVRNAQHETWRHYFSVDDVVLRVARNMVPPLRWALGRMVLIPIMDKLTNVVEEMWVFLVAMKSEERVQDWRKMRKAAGVPARYAVYRHEFENRLRREEEGLDFVTLGVGRG